MACEINSQISTPMYAAIIFNVDTNQVLYKQNAMELRHPASLTKVMTLYLLFDELKKGKISMNTKLKVSRNAASQPRTNMELKAGTYITVRDAIDAMIVHSANDAAVVVAEKLGGNVTKFASMMTQKAKHIGMKHTHFTNPHGLHDPRQVTTAQDMAILGLSIKRHHKQYYSLFSKTSFVFRGKVINSHNRVTKNFHGAKGMKTGYIRASGFNIMTSVHRPEGTILGVVLGGESAASRDNHIMDLLQHAYCKMEKESLAKIRVAHHSSNTLKKAQNRDNIFDKSLAKKVSLKQPKT